MVSDDDIEMFARGLLGRYGEDARWQASDQSARLAASGDAEGERIWRRVAVAVEVLQLKGKRPRFQPPRVHQGLAGFFGWLTDDQMCDRHHRPGVSE